VIGRIVYAEYNLRFAYRPVAQVTLGCRVNAS
jgi:hypothetical protein